MIVKLLEKRLRKETPLPTDMPDSIRELLAKLSKKEATSDRDDQKAKPKIVSS